MEYHVLGWINVGIFALCLAGIGSQWRLIQQRKEAFRSAGLGGERPTDILSLNQFASSFLAFYSFFVYGFVIERFNHYLVWPRLAAACLSLAILYEIAADRREGRSAGVLAACAAATLVALACLAARVKISTQGRLVAQGLVLVSAVMAAQGYTHQMLLIRRTGRSGGVSLRMHQLTFLKDVSTLLLGLAMGLKTGWPLLLTNGLCAVTKLGVMSQLRWARCSPEARTRREAARPTAESNWPQVAEG